MLSASREWLAGLREFAAASRARKPLAHPGALNEEAAERMILSAHLATWLAASEATLGARRSWLMGDAEAREADPEPALVITTSAVGVANTEEQLACGSLPARTLAGRAVAVTELEYRLWCIRHPDEFHALHVNVWNWIKTRVPRQRQAEFARHPLAADECYWLHRFGVSGAGGADRRDCHLWKWNGRHASLLEAFVVERGVEKLG